ncbi:MAG: hypothetical protein DRR08_05075 [Candidatus Parabeggiatoa sp. nov. 2]|nr:MAG: hypothetical protein B6247_03740 [Beggiatoa sp. 4572_84]RKZ62830.1 MAG: hypothetical protein DRR08_05075 [Gammaproteobacteria bacterium]HEC84858.1 hypothetical protein [Thioploca sp.]
MFNVTDRLQTLSDIRTLEDVAVNQLLYGWDWRTQDLVLSRLDQIGEGQHLILPKVDRMLGANGFYSLSPLFDERIIELSFAIPSTLKLAGGDDKVIMKRAFKSQLPRRIITRPKVGMRVPVHFWFQNEMKSYMQHIFSRNAINRAGIFNYERIQKLMEYDIGEAQPRYGLKLWMLLTFEMWRRRVIENEE